MSLIDDSLVPAGAPKEPYLVIMVSPGRNLAVPPGGGVVIVDDVTGKTPPHPLVLKSVNHNLLSFRCGCGQANCTREVVFKARWTGRHPSLFGEQGKA